MPDSSQNIAILILAAGASSRMGKTKQLLPWGSTTLLGNAIGNAKESNARTVIVVLGANSEAIQKEIEKNSIEILINTDWKSGLGSSIACGTEFLLKSSPIPDGILVMLADQPLIDTDYLNAMIGTFASHRKGIVATTYQNRAGVPALFAADYFKKMEKLGDDFGAKKIIASHRENVLEMAPGAKTIDIDTKSDYERLVNRQE